MPPQPQLMSENPLSANGLTLLEIQIQRKLCFLTPQRWKDVLLFLRYTLFHEHQSDACTSVSNRTSNETSSWNSVTRHAWIPAVNTTSPYVDASSATLTCTLGFKNQSFAVVATTQIFYRYERTWFSIFLRISSKCNVSGKSNIKSINLMFQLFDLVSVRCEPLKTFYSGLESQEENRYSSVQHDKAWARQSLEEKGIDINSLTLKNMSQTMFYCIYMFSLTRGLGELYIRLNEILLLY